MLLYVDEIGEEKPTHYTCPSITVPAMATLKNVNVAIVEVMEPYREGGKKEKRGRRGGTHLVWRDD